MIQVVTKTYIYNRNNITEADLHEKNIYQAIEILFALFVFFRLQIYETEKYSNNLRENSIGIETKTKQSFHKQNEGLQLFGQSLLLLSLALCDHLWTPAKRASTTE